MLGVFFPQKYLFASENESLLFLHFPCHGHWSDGFVLTNTEHKHQKELCLCLLSWDWGIAGVYMPWLFFSVQALAHKEVCELVIDLSLV